jgi:mRNA-degrading endonuclease RelE of RelBE toxin-antitoxin system
MAYTGSVAWPLITVAETASYLAWAESVLTEEERYAIVDLLASDPTCGVVLRETGGIRKMRFALAGRGKSGGVRIVYYFYNESMPVYILAGFAKNERANLSAAERATLRRLVEQIKARGIKR